MQKVEHEVVDQVVAVLGEDRLGVELDAAEVRALDQVHVPGQPVTPVGSWPCESARHSAGVQVAHCFSFVERLVDPAGVERFLYFAPPMMR